MKRRNAAQAAKWRSETDLWLSHATLEVSDTAWMGHVERLTLWNVRVAAGVLAALPQMWWLDVRGGSVITLPPMQEATKLRYLAVNQVQRLHDLSWLGELLNLEFLDLYGLSRVGTIPSMHAHTKLTAARLGVMKGLQELSGLIAAPALEDLQFIRQVPLTEADLQSLVAHPTLRTFDWFAEDVPQSVYTPIVARLNKPATRTRWPADWFTQRSKHPTTPE